MMNSVSSTIIQVFIYIMVLNQMSALCTEDVNMFDNFLNSTFNLKFLMIPKKTTTDGYSF
jgi:hypothetical protein